LTLIALKANYALQIAMEGNLQQVSSPDIRQEAEERKMSIAVE
jgi:hypothetical protein